MAFSPAYITSSSNSANTNTHTYSGISFPAGLVVVGVYAAFQSPSGVLASVTINGVAGTLKQSAPTFDGASVCELYEADVSAGTGSVVISANSGQNTIRSVIGVWNVVDGEYVTGATNSASTDSPLDVSVNTSSGDSIVVFACRSTGTPSFTPTGYTEDFEHLVDTTRGATGGLKTGSSGGTPETFTIATGGATGNAGCSVVYKAAAQTITGTAHSSADTFGAGTISQPAGSQTITGAAHSSADAFGTGTVTTGAVTITGAAHSSADTFGAGTISTDAVTITGAAHSSADTFGSGAVTTGAVTITGAAHSSADTFGAGAVTQGLVIIGAAHSSADAFGGGAISVGPVTITGAAWVSADTFGSGALYDPDAAPSPGRYAYAANSRTGIFRRPNARGIYRNGSRTGVYRRG